MPPLIESLEPRQLCRAPADSGRFAFAPPAANAVDVTVEPGPGGTSAPTPQPHYTEIVRYRGTIGRKRHAFPVEIVQRYLTAPGAPAGVPSGQYAGTYVRTGGEEYLIEHWPQRRRFIVQSTHRDLSARHFHTHEFRARLTRGGAVTGTYRLRLSFAADDKTFPFSRWRAPFRLEVVVPPP